MSILTDIKTLLALRDTDAFDAEIVMFINSAFATLRNLGVGPEPAFKISKHEDPEDDETWDQFMEDQTDIESVKEYVWLHVRLVFDPPTIGGVLTAFQERLKELGFRLSTVTDNT